MPQKLEFQQAVTGAIARVTELVSSELELTGQEDTDEATTGALLLQAALLLILKKLGESSVHAELAKKLSHAHMTQEPTPITRTFSEVIDDKERLIEVTLDKNTVRIVTHFIYDEDNGFTLDLPEKHIGILRLFFLTEDSILTTEQIIENGLAGKQSGVTQMIQTINYELYKVGAGRVYIEPQSKGIYKLQATNTSQLMNEFFANSGFTGTFGKYRLKAKGVYEKPTDAYSKEKLVINLKGRAAQILGILIAHKDQTDLSIQEIADNLHASKQSIQIAFSGFLNRFNLYSNNTKWKIVINSSQGATKYYRLIQINN